MANYSFKTIGLPEPVNGIIEAHNFLQLIPHTKIYEGYSGITFRKCNLINCDIPADSVVENCNRSQISFCSHQHEGWVELGVITMPCAENCTHVTGYDTFTIDGVPVGYSYTYEDKAV